MDEAKRQLYLDAQRLFGRERLLIDALEATQGVAKLLGAAAAGSSIVQSVAAMQVAELRVLLERFEVAHGLEEEVAFASRQHLALLSEQVTRAIYTEVTLSSMQGDKP